MHTPMFALTGTVCALALVTTATAQLGQYTLEHHTLSGAMNGDKFGSAFAALGDVNSDTIDDYAIGIPGDSTNGSGAGAVRIVSGADGSTIRTLLGVDPADAFGTSVGAADVNADGTKDVIVGIPGDDTNGGQAGAAIVYSGIDGSVLLSIFGDSASDELGKSVAGVGLIDADLNEDVIVGAPGDDNNGRLNSGSARVVSGNGGGVIWNFDGAVAGDALGTSVASAGNANADTTLDMIVGAPNADPNGGLSGQAIIFSGLDGTVLQTLNGDATGDRFGSSVAVVGNVDGVAGDEVVVGAPGDDNAAFGGGAARVCSGLTGGTVWTADGAAANDFLGSSVAGAGDVNNDGIPDVIAGAPGNPSFPTMPGYALVLDGATGTTIETLNGAAVGDLCGTAVGGVGDIDGDGFDDVIVGSPRAIRFAARTGTATAYDIIYTMFIGDTGCPDSTGDDPDIVANGVARVAGQITIGLTGTAPGNLCAAFGIQPAPAPIPLAVIGAPASCMLYPNLVTSVGMPSADATGTSLLPVLDLASDPGFAGSQLQFQFIVADFSIPAAIPVGLTKTLNLVVGP